VRERLARLSARIRPVCTLGDREGKGDLTYQHPKIGRTH
jgi:hypothetical protein